MLLSALLDASITLNAPEETNAEDDMNPFASLQNDVVYIEDDAGTRTGPYRSGIGSKNGRHTASLFEAELPISEGWKVFQCLPGGREQPFTVLEANYSPGLDVIPAHWSLILRKEGSLVQPSKTVSQTINIAHSTGIQIGDHNVQHIALSLIGLVESIEAAAAPEPQKVAAKGMLREFITSPVVASVLGSAAKAVADVLVK